jgi:ABC-type methionine transport system permease subunit
MKMLNKKGQLGGMQSFIMTIVVVAVVLGVGLIVVTEFQGATTANSLAYNATGAILTKMATIPTWIGIVIVVALAFIVLGFFYGRQQ